MRAGYQLLLTGAESLRGQVLAVQGAGGIAPPYHPVMSQCQEHETNWSIRPMARGCGR